MAEIRGIFGDDDLGFDLDNIEEAEERYIWQLDVLSETRIALASHICWWNGTK
jgi:hypothetical protein